MGMETGCKILKSSGASAGWGKAAAQPGGKDRSIRSDCNWGWGFRSAEGDPGLGSHKVLEGRIRGAASGWKRSVPGWLLARPLEQKGIKGCSLCLLLE